jgi:hypothetical protein
MSVRGISCFFTERVYSNVASKIPKGGIMTESIVWLFAAIMVVVTVTVHYQVMAITSDRIIPWAQKRAPSRSVVAYGITGLLLGHIVEILLFALMMKILLYFPMWGSIQGDFGNGWGDFLYLSTVSYTTLGDSGVRLIGPIRAIAASESLVGLMMIIWSASFSYLNMKTIWERRRTRRD